MYINRAAESDEEINAWSLLIKFIVEVVYYEFEIGQLYEGMPGGNRQIAGFGGGNG